jgi:hypothetical protein
MCESGALCVRFLTTGSDRLESLYACIGVWLRSVRWCVFSPQREKEGRREGGKEGRKEGGKKGRKGRREEGKKGRREEGKLQLHFKTIRKYADSEIDKPKVWIRERPVVAF